MAKQVSFRRTMTACYLGYITQAIANNLAPLLFLTFHREFGIPLSQVALLASVNFAIQLLVDFAAAKYADRIGYRASMILAHICNAVGIGGMAVLPDLLPSPLAGLMICVFFYAVGGGLCEVLVTPIAESCPTEKKDAQMSLLHSFYNWGVVAVVALSTAFFGIFGIENWRVLPLCWALVPILNIYNFAIVPINPIVPEGEGMTIGALLRTRLFWLLLLLTACAGASELAMSQWASTFAELALNVSKTVGDMAGPCLFAVLMGTARVFYAKASDHVDLEKFMTWSAALCVVCYLLASLSRSPIWGLVGCALCGLSVGIMWPGTFSISALRCPLGGTAMFALLALAGDLGGSLGPATVGWVSDLAGGQLKTGILAGIVFPMLMLAGLFLLKKCFPKEEKP